MEPRRLWAHAKKKEATISVKDAHLHLLFTQAVPTLVYAAMETKAVDSAWNIPLSVAGVLMMISVEHGKEALVWIGGAIVTTLPKNDIDLDVMFKQPWFSGLYSSCISKWSNNFSSI